MSIKFLSFYKSRGFRPIYSLKMEISALARGRCVELSRQYRVLVVEDQILIAMDLQNALESQAFEVVGPVQSTLEARTLLADHAIDAALIDFYLEDGDAGPLADLLKSKGIPFALCTGANIQELAVLYPDASIIGKPYKVEDVCRIVNGLLSCSSDAPDHAQSSASQAPHQVLTLHWRTPG